MQLKRVAGSHMSTRIFKLGVGDAPHVDELAFILHADCNSRLTLPTCFACCACIPASNKKLQKRTSKRLRCRHKTGQSLRCKQESGQRRGLPPHPRELSIFLLSTTFLTTAFQDVAGFSPNLTFTSLFETDLFKTMRQAFFLASV